MKFGTVILWGILNDFSPGPKKNLHFLLIFCSFKHNFWLKNQLCQNRTNHISIDRKFYIDSKKGLSLVVKMNIQSVIDAQSEPYDVIDFFSCR